MRRQARAAGRRTAPMAAGPSRRNAPVVRTRGTLARNGGAVGPAVDHRYQAFLDAGEQRPKLRALARRKTGERVFHGRLGDAPDAPVHALGFGREIDALDPPVAVLGAPLDPAIGLEPVDHPSRA